MLHLRLEKSSTTATRHNGSADGVEDELWSVGSGLVRLQPGRQQKIAVRFDFKLHLDFGCRHSHLERHRDTTQGIGSLALSRVLKVSTI